MNNEMTLYGPVDYNPKYAPVGAKKGYVARITGLAPGPVKYEREFLGAEVTLVEGDEGLYERQRGEKKGGYTRWYHVILSHPEHGLIKSTDCESEVPKIAKLLDDGVSIQNAVEIRNMRPSERTEGLWVFDAHARSKAQAHKATAAATIDDAVAACEQILRGLDPSQQKKALGELRKSLSAKADPV